MKQKKVLKRATPYFFILPWIIGFLVFTIGPLIFSLIMSFFNWPLAADPEFVGLGNYLEMFTSDKQFFKSLTISLKYAAIFVPLNMVIALFLAMLITQPVRGVKVFRTIFYIPTVISGVAVSILWGWILNGDYGVLNYLLSLIGIEGPKWLVDPAWAILAVIIASAFGVGSMMLIFYTDIKNIPIDVYEAAAIDGITPWTKLIKIKIPLVMPSIYFVMLTAVIDAFQMFTEIFIMTKGGPGYSTYTVSYYLWSNAFEYSKMGYACAMAAVMFVIIMTVTLVQNRIMNKKVQYDA